MENSESPHALNSKKTECDYGHPFSGDNLKIRYVIDQNAKRHGRIGAPKIATRICMACQRRRTAAANAKRIAAKGPQ